jgi:hypothetical protein
MSLTPLRACLSFATPACPPTRPPVLRLETKQNPIRWRFSFAQPYTELFWGHCHTACSTIGRSLHRSSLTSALSEAIQTP